MAREKKLHDPFRWFDSSPEVIRVAVMMYVLYPLSLRGVEYLPRVFHADFFGVVRDVVFPLDGRSSLRDELSEVRVSSGDQILPRNLRHGAEPLHQISKPQASSNSPVPRKSRIVSSQRARQKLDVDCLSHLLRQTETHAIITAASVDVSSTRAAQEALCVARMCDSNSAELWRWSGSF